MRSAVASLAIIFGIIFAPFFRPSSVGRRAGILLTLVLQLSVPLPGVAVWSRSRGRSDNISQQLDPANIYSFSSAPGLSADDWVVVCGTSRAGASLLVDGSVVIMLASTWQWTGPLSVSTALAK
jgi:hypothetical protein